MTYHKEKLTLTYSYPWYRYEPENRTRKDRRLRFYMNSDASKKWMKKAANHTLRITEFDYHIFPIKKVWDIPWTQF